MTARSSSRRLRTAVVGVVAAVAFVLAGAAGAVVVDPGVVGLAGAVVAPPPVHYVALGDSYSSGVGAGALLAGSGGCVRSRNAYSSRWTRAEQPASYGSLACAGADISAVEQNQLQLLRPSTTLVSLTIGGNDAHFASVMTSCNLDLTSSCVRKIAQAEREIRATLPGRLDGLLSQIRAAAPHARVVVLGYPHFYDLGRHCVGLSGGKRRKIDEGIDVLDGLLAAAAHRAGDVFADVRPAFAGHEICDHSPWLHSVDLFHLSQSYHPTANGQRGGYLPAFTRAAA